jgi:hypothetical protein
MPGFPSHHHRRLKAEFPRQEVGDSTTGLCQSAHSFNDHSEKWVSLTGMSLISGPACALALYLPMMLAK